MSLKYEQLSKKLENKMLSDRQNGTLPEFAFDEKEVLRRKPDIKYKPESDFTELQKLQYRILENAAVYLKKQMES